MATASGVTASRLVEECKAVGVDAIGVDQYERVVFSPKQEGEDYSLIPNDQNIYLLVEAAHIPDDGVEMYQGNPHQTYISTDLESYQLAQNLKQYLTTTSGAWDAYLKLQTDKIRWYRKAAYGHPVTGSDGMRDQYLAEECTKEEWLTTRSGIKDLYPWPGDYR